MTSTARARADAEPPDLAVDRAHELVADAVATVICGATYPVACLTLRIPPGSEAWAARNKHPSWGERVATVRGCLDALTEKTGLARYSVQRKALVDPLAEAVLGRLPPVTAASEQAAAGTVNAVLRHRPGLVFGAADTGSSVAAALRARRPTPPAGATVVAVVDGAWKWRLTGADFDAERAVARLVADYCVALARG